VTIKGVSEVGLLLFTWLARCTGIVCVGTITKGPFCSAVVVGGGADSNEDDERGRGRGFLAHRASRYAECDWHCSVRWVLTSKGFGEHRRTSGKSTRRLHNLRAPVSAVGRRVVGAVLLKGRRG